MNQVFSKAWLKVRGTPSIQPASRKNIFLKFVHTTFGMLCSFSLLFFVMGGFSMYEGSGDEYTSRKLPLTRCINNVNNRDAASGAFNHDVSDPFQIFCLSPVKHNEQRNSHDIYFYRKITQDSPLKFQGLVQSVDWSRTYLERNPNIACHIFENKISL